MGDAAAAAATAAATTKVTEPIDPQDRYLYCRADAATLQEPAAS